MANFCIFSAIFGLFRPSYYHSFLNRKKETFIKVSESESFIKIKKLFGILGVKIAFKKLFWFLIKKSGPLIESSNNLKKFLKRDFDSRNS